ncbi:glycosyltransferase [Guptibacillus hwajinpoensis]|uniref:glycosyltransferase n=1 Tax=Guptibacillus hwajinpoensis TaxID=208199 RepID=UPI0024B35F69|nr:glycosyltransferase [Pseudalkalibacillus hwajinpoensis]
MKKKKIVFLITGLYYGGMERVVFIAHKLLENQYDVNIVTLYADNADYKPDFDYIDLKCPPKPSKISKIINLAKRTKSVSQMKKDMQPDIVMSFGTAANFSNVASKGKEKVLVGIRSYDWLYNYFATRFIDKWTYQKADKVISVSKVIAQGAEKIFSIEKSKSEVLYNPYDVEYIGEKAKEEINEVDIQNNKINIISVGRLVNQKGFNHLIKAFSIVINEFPEAKLYIVGKGNKEKDIKKLISDLDLTDNIVLLGGQDNPYKYMEMADLYVLSSISEGFPNALVESMSVGLPVLAVDCKSGPREILSLDSIHKEAKDIEECEYGVMAPKVSGSFNYNANYIEDCDRSLAKGIKLFLNDSKLRREYSKKSFCRAQEFTYEKFEKKLTYIFENL